MKAIIAGSRTITDYELLKPIIKSIDKPINIIISGGAKGVDMLGERYAKDNNIDLKVMKADWNVGRHAGFLRNEEMAYEAAKDKDGICIVIWDGKSKGSSHMISMAKKYKLELFIFDINDNTALDINKL